MDLGGVGIVDLLGGNKKMPMRVMPTSLAVTPQQVSSELTAIRITGSIKDGESHTNISLYFFVVARTDKRLAMPQAHAPPRGSHPRRH